MNPTYARRKGMVITAANAAEAPITTKGIATDNFRMASTLHPRRSPLVDDFVAVGFSAVYSLFASASLVAPPAVTSDPPIKAFALAPAVNLPCAPPYRTLVVPEELTMLATTGTTTVKGPSAMLDILWKVMFDVASSAPSAGAAACIMVGSELSSVMC
jgi:hypothetical protein